MVADVRGDGGGSGGSGRKGGRATVGGGRPGWIFDATCAGETLISRYRVCSELAGSQSERVLTLAAHSTLPLVGVRLPRFPLRALFRSSHPLPVCALRLPCYLCRQRKPPPAADHIRLWRKLRRSSPSEPTFQFFFLSLWRPKVSWQLPAISAGLNYFHEIFSLPFSDDNATIQFSDKDRTTEIDCFEFLRLSVKCEFRDARIQNDQRYSLN